MAITADRIQTWGTWSTASSYLGAAFDFGFVAKRVSVASLDAGVVYFSLESTTCTISTGGLVTTSSGIYVGTPVAVVSSGETATVDGSVGMVSVYASSTGRWISVRAFRS